MRNGSVDLQALGDRPVELNGDWSFLKQGEPDAPRLVPVPGPWPGERARGIAYYRLSIDALSPGDYSLYLPPTYTAVRISMNGDIRSQAGTIGMDAASTRVVPRAENISWRANGKAEMLQIEVAAFRHRDNGIEQAPVLGRANAIQRWMAIEYLKSAFFLTSLLLIAVTSLVIFAFRRQDIASLYLATSFVAAIPIALAFSHDNMVTALWPGLPFKGLLFIQYGFGLLSVSAFLGYVEELFGSERWTVAGLAFQTTFVLLFFMQVRFFVTGDTLAASELSRVSEPFRFAMFVYILAVVGRAVIRRRAGALTFFVGNVVLLVTLSLRALVTNGFVTEVDALNIDLPSFGAVVFLFSQIVIIAQRWALATREAEKLGEDRRRLLEVSNSITSEIRLDALLAKIVAAASAIVGADRSSLFLYDAEAEQLVSIVAEGTNDKIRFDSRAGLAGHSFTTGEVSNVANAYDDPRFNGDIDRLTGFKTRSVLTVPVVTRNGKRLGVLQALNTIGRPAFGRNAIVRLTAFAAQAAIALENATLFTEVESQRNYNANILNSMSNGVVTLDVRARSGTLNRAARRLLEGEGRTDDQVCDEVARLNPWVEDQFSGYGTSLEQKDFRDVPLLLPSGRSLTVNATALPLRTDEGVTGLLFLVDDLTQDKRLKDTMRRFLNPQVVDELLERDDDALFGQNTRASVMFADIRGFTTISERLSAPDVVAMLNRVFTEMFEAVVGHQGMLDKYIGDAIMAVFGAPSATPADAANAVASALAMLRALREQAEKPNLIIGVGIASGDVIAGTIGSPKRMEYTVIGDAVNLAARLQDMTKVYGVELLICEETAKCLPADLPIRKVDFVQVRGRKKRGWIYEVKDQIDCDHRRDQMLEIYQIGLDFLEQGKLGEAESSFRRAHRLDNRDGPAKYMIERLRRLKG